MQSTTATTTTLSTVPKITWDSLQLGSLIGNGSFGDVYQGIWNGKAVAIKLLQMKTLTANLVTDFTKESQLMWDCQSDNTLSLHGICLEPGHCAMVTEYMGQGSLYNVINNQELSEEQCWQIALGMAKGLSLIHSKDIIHRDFKSFNVLIDDSYQAKICDFGLAKLKTAIASGSTSTKKTGSVRWKAPELFKFKAVATKASDIYSFGMVLWELASKRLPFSEGSDDITVMGWIKDGAQEDIPEDCPEAWQNIIKSCWAEANLRPTAVEIVTQLEAAMPRPMQSISEDKSWHFATKPDSSQIQSNYALLKGEQADYDKVQQYYQHHPVPGYSIQSVEVIYNPALNRSFALKMSLLQERHGNIAFAPRWQQEHDADWRARVHQIWQDLTTPYQDSDYPNISLLPLWHGTSPTILDSIFRTGYANLATTDAGYFGKGLYSAYEAEYANRVYSKGALILNWVASFSAYPVIHGDMDKLSTKGNYANYDTHFIPVAPNNPNKVNETAYYPTKPNQKITYHEVVVFDNGQCLPRYLVTLQAGLLPPPPANIAPTLDKSSSNIDPAIAAKLKAEQELAAAIAAKEQAEQALAIAKAKAESEILAAKIKAEQELAAIAVAKEQAAKEIAEAKAQAEQESILAKLKAEQELTAAITAKEQAANEEIAKAQAKAKQEAKAIKIKAEQEAMAAKNKAEQELAAAKAAQLQAEQASAVATPKLAFSGAPHVAYPAPDNNQFTPSYTATTTSISLGKTPINQKELNKFIKLVADGEQDQAETMLQQHPTIALHAGYVRDLSDRIFNSITGFQYAVWALDSHMWHMILRYLPFDIAREQIEGMATGSWVAEHGNSVSWQNLINSLDRFIGLCNKKQWDEASKHWCGPVSDAQRLLPVHVVNQYCHPVRPFYLYPEFKNELPLPRTRSTIIGEWFIASYNGLFLGNNCFAFFCGSDRVQMSLGPTFDNKLRQAQKLKEDNQNLWSEQDTSQALATLLDAQIKLRERLFYNCGSSKLLIQCSNQQQPNIKLKSLIQNKTPEMALANVNYSNQFTPSYGDYNNKESISMPSLASFKVEEQINQESLRTFLELIVRGQQDQAERMIQQNFNLAIVPGNVVDLSGRTFNNMTGLQYAIWALDWHMWNMIIHYLPYDIVREQIKGMETGSWVVEHGNSASWQHLINAMNTFIKLCVEDKWIDARNQWRSGIGNAQHLLPVHVVNEYCHPTRSFNTCPDFKDRTKLPRSMATDIGDWFTATHNGGIIGNNCFAFYRATAATVMAGEFIAQTWAGWRGERVAGRRRIKKDKRALVKLLLVRIEQRDQLFTEFLEEKPGKFQVKLGMQ